MRLEDRIAIVTGAARGLGRGLAQGLAGEGANVAVADVNLAGAEDTAAKIRSLGRESLALQVNVTQIDQIDQMVERVVEAFGRIDILINNAGLIQRALFLETTEEEYDKVLDVNLKGVFFCAQRVARVMARQGRGKLVNISSTSGFVSGGKMAPYEVSKAGVRMLTVSLAAELAPYNINVNAIAPGMVTTERTLEAFVSEEIWQQRARDTVPLKRPGYPEDLVGAAVFLSSDESDYVTGHTLVIDGGKLST